MKTTKEKIEVMKAYEEGKVIECRSSGLGWKEWILPQEPAWNWAECDYRVKEEPKYRPYESIEELINDFCERSYAKRSPMGEPYIWVKNKETGIKDLITGFDEKSVTVRIGVSWYSENLIFEDYTYLDGSPCGKKIEE